MGFITHQHPAQVMCFAPSTPRFVVPLEPMVRVGVRNVSSLVSCVMVAVCLGGSTYNMTRW